MYKIFLAILFIGVCSIDAAYGQQGSLDEQEKCDRKARLVFREQINSIENKAGLLAPSYTSHYNKNMGRCFMSMEYYINTSQYMNTIDAFENRSFATYSSVGPIKTNYCQVEDVNGDEITCNSYSEYKNLTKEYTGQK